MGIKIILYNVKRKLTLLVYKTRRRHSLKTELFKSNGNEYQDKTFYIIGVDEGWCGLFAIVVHQLTHIAYAVEKGYIPVIDLKNYTSQYVDFNDRFKINAWELFFEQPFGFDLDNVKNAKNVVYSISCVDPPDNKYKMPYEKTIYNFENLKYWSELFRSNIRINSHVQKEINDQMNFIFQDKKRVLGVHLRGTDYLTLKPTKHPIQPSLVQAIEKVKQCLLLWDCNYIYLATEDANIYEAFIKAFGETLIQDNSNRWTEADLNGGKSNSDLLMTTEEKRNEGIEYLSHIYMLSKCTSFVGGNTRGSLGVLLMNHGFENHYIFDFGLYP